MASDGKIIIKGFDWGPAATKVVINVGTDSDQIRNIETTLFVVKEERKNEKDTLNSERTVTDAYYSDEYGSRTENNGGFISLELGFSPEEGSPMFYDFATGFNKWFDYKLKVKFGDAKETVLNNEDFYFPEIKDVDLSGRFTGSEGHSLTYASFIPKNASAENLRPLVIWLHGMGEGGTDLAGKFVATCTDGTWVYDCEDEGNSRLITVTFPQPLTISKNHPASFRFFALPQDLKNLRITFWTNEGTKSTKLMQKGSVDQNTGDGTYVTFAGTKYHKIKGLVLPAGMFFRYITLDLQVLEWQTTNMTGVSEEFPQSTQFAVTGAKNGTTDLNQGTNARQKWYFKPGETVTVTFKMMLPAGGTWELVPVGGEEGNEVAADAKADASLFTIRNVSSGTATTNLYGPINNSGSTDVKIEITYNGTDTAQHCFHFLTYAYSGANKTGEKYSIDSETQLYDRGRGYHTFYVNSPLYN